MVVSAHVRGCGGAEARAQRLIACQARDRRRQRIGVAGGNDEAVASVSHEASGSCADGVAGDHGEAAIHGLVDDQPPGLEEGAGGD